MFSYACSFLFSSFLKETLCLFLFWSIHRNILRCLIFVELPTIPCLHFLPFSMTQCILISTVCNSSSNRCTIYFSQIVYRYFCIFSFTYPVVSSAHMQKNLSLSSKNTFLNAVGMLLFQR